MTVRSWTKFNSDLPEDAIEGPDDFIQWPGKSVIFAIAELLKECGYEVEEPTHQYEHGWDLFFQSGKRRFWLQVTLIEKYYLVVEESRWLRFFGHWPEYFEALSRLSAALNTDPRFSDVRWFTQEEMDRKGHVEGALAPLDDG